MELNEKRLMELELLLSNYYNELDREIKPFNTKGLCDATKKISPSLDLEGCKTDMQEIMMRGIRECLSIIMTSINMRFVFLKSEEELTHERLIKRYINDSLVLNLCIFFNTL